MLLINILSIFSDSLLAFNHLEISINYWLNFLAIYCRLVPAINMLVSSAKKFDSVLYYLLYCIYYLY